MVMMAWGIHLFPYRTQKLSLITLMVLGGRPPGRVRNRQITRASQLTSSFLLTEYTNLARPAEWGPKTRFFQKLFRPTGLSFRHKQLCPNSWTQIKAYLPIPNTENKSIRLMEDPPRSGSPKVKVSLRLWYSELAVRLL